MNRVNPKLNTFAWDYVRAVATGLVTNGHVVLLVAVCFGAFFMGRGLQGLAERIDQSEQRPQVENTKLANAPKEVAESPDEFREASDERIDEHYRCSSTQYRKANETMCVALDRYVAEAIRRDRGSEVSH